MKLKRLLIRIFTRIIYLWGTIWYEKKYLQGIFFQKDHFSAGWKWILKYWFPQKVLGYGKKIPFPVPKNVIIGHPENLIFDPDDLIQIHSPNCYFQGIGAKIIIGKGAQIAPNCGFITANHDINDITKHAEGKSIIIGKNCWIGMNSVLLPGVKLGDHTIVGAGSIVTKSFEEGNCIIAGNPAQIIKKLKKES